MSDEGILQGLPDVIAGGPGEIQPVDFRARMVGHRCDPHGNPPRAVILQPNVIYGQSRE
jgi:hypothetical protein